MILIADVLLITLAVIGALFGLGGLIATLAYFAIRGLRPTRRVHDGDEQDEIWT